MTSSSTYTGNVAQTVADPTLAERLTVTKGRPSGFDYMRVVLALSVICWHSLMISNGINAEPGAFERLLGPLSLLIVPMFFALSGFLVAGSLERSKTLIGFLGLRIFRIMPALSVEVLISALILGPVFTTLSLREYFSHPELHSYFFNIIGDIHYKLPGVFQENPSTLVNGQLWTVPYELVCYIMLSVLSVLGIVRRRHLLLGFIVVYYVAQLANTLLRPSTDFQGAGGSSIVMAFIAGLLLFRYRDKVTWSKALFAVAFVLSIALPMFIPKGMRFAALPIAYVTVYLGLLNPPRNRLLLSGDYSYGLFLYGFPVEQAVYSASPHLQTWYGVMLIAVPVTAAIAAASWWTIEKPILGQRDKLKLLENWYLRRFRGATTTP
jgi:peptidoglycan/LPS O-acetylase OafA/YrhL